MDVQETIDKLAANFGLFNFLYGFIPVNWVPVGRKNVETDRKMLVYLIAPVAFGTKFPNRLLAKCAEHVGYGRNGPLDPYIHSSAEEEKLLQMLHKVHTFMLVMKSVPSSGVYQAKFNLNSVLKMKDPEDVISFGKEKCVAFLGVGEWLMDDALVLIYVITLLLVFNEDFCEEAFKELITCGADNIFDAALTIESADRAVRNGNFADGLELYTRALKLNPLNDKIYNKLSQMYCTVGKYEFGRWFAVRSVWLLPYEAENHLQWLRSAELMPEMTVVTMKFAQLIHSCALADRKFKKVAALVEIEALFQRLRFRVLGSVVCGMTTDGYPPNILSKKSEPNSPFGHEIEDKKWSDLRFVFHAFTELFGCMPLQWLHLYPALQPPDRNYNIEELQLIHENFVDLISPFAFGVNYPNPNLAKCAEYLNIFHKDPIKHSLEVEMETLALIRFAQSFLIFNRQTSGFSQVSKKDVKKVLQMSDPKKIIEFGKSIISEIFKTSVEWIEDEKAVFLYMVSLMMSQFKLFADSAFNVHNVDMNAFQYACNNNLAKACMQRKNYTEALSLYSKASQLYPRESIVLGNMAQVYICIGEYETARRFALRSILGTPFIPKNYYRWIKATDMMGKLEDVYRICSSVNICFNAGGYFGVAEHCAELEAMCGRLCRKVLNANSSDRKETKKTEESVKRTENLNESRSSSNDIKTELPTTAVNSTTKVFIPDSSNVQVPKTSNEIVVTDEPQNNVNVLSNNGKSKLKSTSVDSTTKKLVKQKAKGATQSTPKEMSKKKKNVVTVSSDEGPKQETEQLCNSSSTYQKYLRDASNFLIKSVYKSAVENYSAALELLHSEGSEALMLSEIDVILLKYCYGKACIERSTHEHIRISIEMFDEIVNQNCLSFPMAYYGKGLALYRLNKFSEALVSLEKCLSVISKRVRFEAYLYPGLPTEVINESYRDKLKGLVGSLVKICRTPPVQDAFCFNKDCALSSKIYCSDVEFLGYSRLTCRDKCHIEFHPICWRGFMTANKIHGDKDVLGRPCCTPDCKSIVTKLELIGPDGLVRKMLTETVESKPKQLKSLLKHKNKPTQKEVLKQVIKKRVHTDSTSDNSDVLEERRSPSLEKEQSYKITTSAPDLRDAENALLILKKLDHDLPSKHLMKKLVSNPEKKKKSLKCEFDYKFIDRDRICTLQAQREVAEATASNYVSVRLDSESPFAIPSQDARSNPLVLETYLRQLESSNVSPNATNEFSDVNFIDCCVLKRNVLEYIEQYVTANGPVSITSRRFLDEINSFPTEVQDLMISFGGIKSFLSASQLLFIGGIALMRGNLKEFTSGSLYLRSLDVAVDCTARFTGSCLKTSISVPNFLESGLCNFVVSNETSSVDRVLTDDFENSSRSNNDTFSNADKELDLCDEEEIDKDESCNVLEDESELSLVEELQSCKDKLFGLRKEMSVEIRQLKDQLEEAQEINEASQKKIQELERACNNLTKKLAAEKQNAKQEILALQTKIVVHESEAAKMLMNEQKISNEGKRQRLKLEGDVDELMKTLAAMESNHDGFLKENRELKERVVSLELELANEVDKSKMTKAAKEPKKLDQIPPLLPYPPCNSMNNPYYSHPKVGAPFYGSFPIQYQPVLRPVIHDFRPSTSLENLYIRPVSHGNYSLSSPVKTNKSETSSVGTSPMPFADKPATVPRFVQPTLAVSSTSIKQEDRDQPDSVVEPKGKKSSDTPPPSSDTDPTPIEVKLSENGNTIVEGLKGCSLLYSVKAAVQPKVLPQAQKTVVDSGSGFCSEYVNRIFEQVKKRIPGMHKSEFLTYLQLVRATNKNSLTGLKLKVIVSRVCKEVQDFNNARKRSVSASSSRSCSESKVEPPIASGPSFWTEVIGSKTGAKSKKKIGEDVCSICLFDINECDAHFLQCSARHVFHKKCIRVWYIKGEETCPLCRETAPLHEDFPALNY